MLKRLIPMITIMEDTMTKPFSQTRRGRAFMRAFWLYLIAVVLLVIGNEADLYGTQTYGILVGINGLILIAWLGHAVSPGSFKD